jgi:hypothetical protein
MVYATEKRVSKDGTVWNKDIVELLGFNLKGKINSVTQFYRDKSK